MRYPRQAQTRAIAAVSTKEDDMRGVFLWLLGIPIPVIILLYLFHVI